MHATMTAICVPFFIHKLIVLFYCIVLDDLDSHIFLPVYTRELNLLYFYVYTPGLNLLYLFV